MQLKRLLLFLLCCVPLHATIAITWSQPQFGYNVLPNASRNVQVSITGCSTCLVNYTVVSGAATLNGATSVTNGIGYVRVKVGATAGHITSSGTNSSNTVVTSTANVVIQAQSAEDTTKTAQLTFHVAALTTNIQISEPYQQAWQGDLAFLSAWVLGNTGQGIHWSVTSSPTSGNGVILSDGYRLAAFTATVPGRYTIQAQSTADTSKTTTAIVYVASGTKPLLTLTLGHSKFTPCEAEPGFTTDDEVGAGQAFTTIRSVSGTAYGSGTLIRVHAGTFHEIIGLQRSGTINAPNYLCGITDGSGNMAIIDGTNAVEQTNMNTYEDGAGLIVVYAGTSSGGLTGNSQDGNPGPNYTTVAGLQLQNAHVGVPYTLSGVSKTFADGAACIRANSGQHVAFINNSFQNCSVSGYQTANADSNGWATLGQFFSWQGNYGSGQGTATTAGSENQLVHGYYLEGYFTTMIGNSEVSPTTGMQGSCYKIRSVGTIAGYNFCQGAFARGWDYTEPQDDYAYVTFERFNTQALYGGGWSSTPEAFTLDQLAGYQEAHFSAFNFGNIFDIGSANYLHYGDDGTTGLSMHTQSGDLYVYNNTVNGTAVPVAQTTQYGRFNQPTIHYWNNSFYGLTAQSYGYQFAISDQIQSIIDFKTNLFEVNGGYSMVTVTTPVTGGNINGGGSGGFSNAVALNPYPKASPMDTHLTGFTSANFLTATSTPYSTTTFIPSPASTGTDLTAQALPFPIQYQFAPETGLLMTRSNASTVGARDAVSVAPTVSIQGLSVQGVTIQ